MKDFGTIRDIRNIMRHEAGYYYHDRILVNDEYITARLRIAFEI